MSDGDDSDDSDDSDDNQLFDCLTPKALSARVSSFTKDHPVVKNALGVLHEDDRYCSLSEGAKDSF